MRGLSAGVMFVVAIVGLAFWYEPLPGTPQELFEVRCSTCHARPDLSGYTAHERRSIVMTMLRERGADKVITADEATRIIGYITKPGIVNIPKDKTDGDT